MTQLPDRPPSDWTQDITDGQVNYFADDQFKKEVIEYNLGYLYWDELKYPGVKSRSTEEGLGDDEVVPADAAGACSLFPTQAYVFDYPGDCEKPSRNRQLPHRHDTHPQQDHPVLEQSYIINSFMEEAIASSILESAATTRKVAKEMLKQGRKPQNTPSRWCSTITKR